MQYLVKILKNMLPKTVPKPVGRWTNECNNKTNKKIDFSNVDHCGPCGQNSLKYEMNGPKKNKSSEIEIYKD
jgi:hypothetical protein